MGPIAAAAYKTCTNSRFSVISLPFVQLLNMTDFPAQDLYQIGSVTALTGIAAERLRAWERRYGFAPAERKGKFACIVTRKFKIY